MKTININQYATEIRERLDNAKNKYSDKINQLLQSAIEERINPILERPEEWNMETLTLIMDIAEELGGSHLQTFIDGAIELSWQVCESNGNKAFKNHRDYADYIRIVLCKVKTLAALQSRIIQTLLRLEKNTRKSNVDLRMEVKGLKYNAA